MFFKNLFSKFALIFFIFSVNYCFSMDLELLSDKRQYSTPERRVEKVKRQKRKDKENVKMDFNKAHLLQDAWVRQDPKLLSPASKQYLISLQKSYPNPIKNPQFIASITKGDIIASPVARQWHNRREMQILLENGEVTSLPANAFSEFVELPPETIEQKKLRKKLLHEYFLSINKIDYSIYKNLAHREAAYWVPFWNYIAIAKKEVLENTREKIRPEELEDVAQASALKEYQSFKAGETQFYYHPDFVDFSFKDSFGRTNAHRLQTGLNPIGRDGHVMEIHHLTMFDDSILVLLSRSCHDGHTLKEATQDTTATSPATNNLCALLKLRY